MAEKIERPSTKTSPERGRDDEGSAAARDVSVIAPERRQVIAGRAITMREPTWIEGMELEPSLAPFIAEINATFADGQAVDWASMQRILYRHREPLISMMGICADVEPDWVLSLSDREGQKLQALFWAVNAPFFGRRVRLLRVSNAVDAALVGQKLSMH